MIVYILSFFKCIIDYYLCAWVFSWFFERRKKSINILILATVGISLLLLIVNSFKVAWINTIFSLCGALFLNHILFIARWSEKLVTSFISIILSVICEFFPIIALSTMLNDNMSNVLEKTINNAGFNLIGSGLFYVVLKIGHNILSKRYIGNTQINLNSNGWSNLFPIISIIFVYYTLYADACHIKTRQDAFINFILYIFIIVSNVGFFLGETSAEKKFIAQSQLNELRLQQSKADAIMKLTDEHIKEMKGLMHDYDAQLNGLMRMVSESSITQDTAFKYVEQMKENIHEANRFIFVESRPLQLILNQTNEKCISYGIDFIVDIRYGSFDFISFPDIFSLFENALDNAINACLSLEDRKEAVIKMKMLKKSNQVFVMISNTYNKKISPKKYYSTARATSDHGYGLHNIKKIVRKYNGTFHLDDKTEFKIMISFPLTVSL